LESSIINRKILKAKKENGVEGKFLSPPPTDFRGQESKGKLKNF
jgi:hypothetical protein